MLEGPKRTPMAEDIKEILAQNRMILELNAKIVKKMLKFVENPIVHMEAAGFNKEDILKHTGSGIEL